MGNLNGNVVATKVQWAVGDKGYTGLRRVPFTVVQVIRYAETEVAKGEHLLVTFEDGAPRVVPCSAVGKYEK